MAEFSNGKVNKVAREKFNSYVNSGGRLKLSDLNKLNPLWKQDYAEAIIEEGDIITKNFDKKIITI